MEGSVKEILADINFQKGFGVMGACGDEFSYRIFRELKDPRNPDASFDWRIAQWASHHSLAKEYKIYETADAVVYENISKRISCYRTGGIQLECFTSKEYERPRKSGEAWVHLLIEQVLQGQQRVHFREMKHLYMSLDFTVTKCEQKMREEEYDPGLHAGQAVWYITIENELSEEVTPEGRPDYFWFGMPVFDSRMTANDDNYFLDKGTKKLIYCIGSNTLYGGATQTGKRYRWTYDILPAVRKAFGIARENEFLPGAEFDHMVIGSTNFGWEMPGTFDGSIRAEKISIAYE